MYCHNQYLTVWINCCYHDVVSHQDSSILHAWISIEPVKQVIVCFFYSQTIYVIKLCNSKPYWLLIKLFAWLLWCGQTQLNISFNILIIKLIILILFIIIILYFIILNLILNVKIKKRYKYVLKLGLDILASAVETVLNGGVCSVFVSHWPAPPRQNKMRMASTVDIETFGMGF